VRLYPLFPRLLHHWVEPLHFLLRRFVRNKNEALCDEVDLLDASNGFVRIRYLDGRESTVSTTDPARSTNGGNDNSPAIEHDQSLSTSDAENTVEDEIRTANQTELRSNELCKCELLTGKKRSSTFQKVCGDRTANGNLLYDLGIGLSHFILLVMCECCFFRRLC